ncbi:hypothetical protein [Methanococcoides methylutens]|uniref:hypothetical protein n=1 Tax=Methanococcoides methylutens TaxID=2226 RepID=UPI00064F9B91|nr:hypothetical protein [Methanococcoides methylutens]
MTKEQKLFCQNCNTELEKQVIGLNTFYCCRECMSMTSVREIVKLKLDMMKSIEVLEASS